MMIVLSLILILNIPFSLAMKSNPPIWSTSEFFRAGNQDIIATLTDQSTVPIPQFTFIFSSPLSGMPKLGYGIKSYHGISSRI